jgi:hypothetical protein
MMDGADRLTHKAGGTTFVMVRHESGGDARKKREAQPWGTTSVTLCGTRTITRHMLNAKRQIPKSKMVECPQRDSNSCSKLEKLVS